VAPSPAAAAPPADVAIADEIFATLGSGRQIAPFTSRPAGLTRYYGANATGGLAARREVAP